MRDVPAIGIGLATEPAIAGVQEARRVQGHRAFLHWQRINRAKMHGCWPRRQRNPESFSHARLPGGMQTEQPSRATVGSLPSYILGRHAWNSYHNDSISLFIMYLDRLQHGQLEPALSAGEVKAAKASDRDIDDASACV